MKDAEIDRLTHRYSSALSPSCVDEEVKVTQKALLNLLLEGAPVTPEALARYLDRDLAKVRAVIPRLGDLEFDSSGGIVGSGISLRPTPHRMVIEGRVMFAWCAWDTLTFPPLLDRQADVTSSCPRSKTPIQLVVTPTAVKAVKPREAVLSLVAPSSIATCCGIRESFCSHANFFRSSRDASEWLDEHPGGVLLGVQQASELGRRLTRLAT